MIAQDAFRTRLAFLQRVVPFDVAGVRQLLAGAIRKVATRRDAKSGPNRDPASASRRAAAFLKPCALRSSVCQLRYSIVGTNFRIPLA
jgi:hypothetical protein